MKWTIGRKIAAGFSLALVAIVVAPAVVFLALLVAFVITRVESGLTKFSRTAEVTVAIPVAPASRAIAVVTIVASRIALIIGVRVVPVVERFAKISAVEFAVAKTRVVILCGSPVNIRVSVVGLLAAVLAIIIALPVTLVITGVQSSLA